MSSYYTNLIIELTKCQSEEAPGVEGFLRVIYGTLDSLDRKTFRREAKKALFDVRGNPKLALDIAKSYGLIQRTETK